MKFKPIVWDEGRYSCYRAHIGRAAVATVNYSMSRSDALPWTRTVDAFGFRVSKQYATREAAQTSVEGALRRILAEVIDDTEANTKPERSEHHERNPT